LPAIGLVGNRSSWNRTDLYHGASPSTRSRRGGSSGPGRTAWRGRGLSAISARNAHNIRAGNAVCSSSLFLVESDSMIGRMVRELRRRRVFRTGALYIIAAWAALQVADLFFSAMGIPEAALRALIWAAFVGFPVALVFGFFFDVGTGGIRRTPVQGEGAVEPQPLRRGDYVILTAFLAVAVALIWSASERVRETSSGAGAARVTEPTAAVQKLANSIAVLPFENISSDSENEYFCEGVSEEILHELSNFRGLSVIGRTSSFAFKGSDYGIARISGLLGVRYVLQGSVRKHGQQLRIAAQLLDENGVQVWSERFDRQLANVFAIQSEIAAAVAKNVANLVTSQNAPAHVPSIEAYEAFLRGRSLLHQREPWAAIPLLRKAVELDERFAEAHAELAIGYLTGGDLDPGLRLARETIDRAIALEPDSLRAQAAEGMWLLSQQPPEAEQAEHVLRAVIARDPNSSDALLWLANALVHLGRGAESREILEQAYRIDPLHPSVSANLAARMTEDGDLQGATRLMRQHLQMPGVGGTAFLRYARAVRQMGNLIEFHETAKLAAMRDLSFGYPLLGHSYRVIARPQKAAVWFERAAQVVEFPIAKFLTTVRASGHEAESLAEFERVLERTGTSISEESVSGRVWYGALLARAGEYAKAIDVLEPIIASHAGPMYEGGLPEFEGVHALAWSYLQTGARDEAHRVLAAVEPGCRDPDPLVKYQQSDDLHYCAEHALLLGDRDLALSMLQKAVDVGWRGYYLREFDPYWRQLDGDTRYRALMAQAKEEVDRQRVEIERIDAADTSFARFEASMQTGKERDNPRRTSPRGAPSRS
jgi:TolB-like protein